jgi:hypothetical protein
MPKCGKCDWDYPNHLVHPIQGNQRLYGLFCPICALEVINEALGIKREKFDGRQAERLRQEAFRWRTNHPK